MTSDRHADVATSTRAGRRRFPRPALIAVVVLLNLAAITAIGLQAQQRARIRAAVPNAPLDLNCPDSPAPGIAGPSFAGQTVINQNFAYQDLRNANFSGAVLDGVIFVGANLQGANFRGAKFTNALNGENATALPTDFSQADLGGACFVGADFEAKAAPVYMSDANLGCADFSATDISQLNVVFGPQLKLGATAATCRTRFRWTLMNCEFIDQWNQLDLSNAALGSCAAGPGSTDLKGRNFDNATMDGFDFYQAQLHGTSWKNAQLHGANMAYTDLSGADFTGVQMGVQPGSGSSLAPANLTGAYMLGVDFTDADLRSVSLVGAHIYGGNQVNGGVAFVRTRLDSADLSNAVIPAGVFSGSLTNASFDGTVLANAVFNGADLRYAKFVNAYLNGTDFSSASSMEGSSLNNSTVSTAAGYWQFTEQDGTPYTYGYGVTQLGLAATTAGSFCPNSDTGPCIGAKLQPSKGGPYPPAPPCVPKPPHYDNCPPPKPPGG